jgi:hypothetical protein
MPGRNHVCCAVGGAVVDNDYPGMLGKAREQPQRPIGLSATITGDHDDRHTIMKWPHSELLI